MAVGNQAQTPIGWRRFADHGQHYVTCPLGEGNVGWPRLFSKLSLDGYGGYLSAEPHCEAAYLMAAWKQAIAFLQGTSAASTT